ncbi:sec-independent protein translocase protein TATA, chloroplastic-like [Hibiscus syriacus]|uniref:sec-independent protein translocase protein TATA, chloroplastic-like n=1 Tax=Hibiscus syriacus TaxID=106335 RepID=UPI001923F5D9|nr:sec-independent protein translocase protein TATA, chloroplastic-like [Hibiscus syriacus]
MEFFYDSFTFKTPAAAASLFLSSPQSNFISSSNTIFLLSRSKSQKKPVSFVVGRPGRRTTVEPARKGFTCNALFGLGLPELVVIGGVAALVFGPKKLPEVGKTIGKTFQEFSASLSISSPGFLLNM